VLTYPLSLTITRLQVQRKFKTSKDKTRSTNDNEDYTSIPDALHRIYAEEGGLPAFYSGCTQDTLKSMADSFLFFLAYNFTRKNRLQKHGMNAKKLPVYEELAVGMVAGAFSKFFTTPMQQIVTRKQTAAMIAKRDSTASSERVDLMSSRDIARRIREQKGIAGFWSGYSASLVLTINPSLTMLFHETLLRVLVKRDDRANPGARMTFLLAAISKVLASTITYPFSLAKSRAQVSAKAPTADDDERISWTDSTKEGGKKAARKVRKDTIFDTVLQIAREEGMQGLYQGLSGEVMKGFFSHGLTMLMKERIHRLVIQLYYFVLKAVQRYPSTEEISKLASEKAGGVKDAVAEAALDAREAVGDAAKSVVSSSKALGEQGQEVLEKVSESMAELYRKGREETADILDDYVNTDDDDNGWGW
jgi:hypothetical protein